MSIRVEFYGIPRQRTGVAATVVDVATQPAALQDVIRQLSARFPQLADTCFEQDRLRAGYTANLNGERFLADSASPLPDGSCLLILSSDAGG